MSDVVKNKGGRPKKERPADPIFSHVHAHEGKSLKAALPALARMPAPILRNAPSTAELDLGRAARRIEALEAEIAALNARKSAVYKELAAQGYTKADLQFAMRDARVDPIVRAEREERRKAYMAALERSAELLAVEDVKSTSAALKGWD